MALPEELDHCPITPECAARRLFRIDGDLYKFSSTTHKFEPHTCNTAGMESRLPEIVYTGEWINNRTKRTRYNGPFRAKVSALKPPPDGSNMRKRSLSERENEWTLVKVHYDNPNWKELS